MKLQISFDSTNLNQALETAKKVDAHCDLFEIGSLTLFAFGVRAIEAFRQQFPQKPLVADTKIIDRGAEITELMAKGGADFLTVMGGTNKHVLHTVAQAASQTKTHIIFDLIDSSAPGQTAMDAQGFGAHAIVMHKPHDEGESLEFLDSWSMVRGNTPLPIFIAAKINRSNVDKIIALKPDGIIVGSAITQASDPVQEAQFFYQLCKQKA